ncbi:MAG: hypothetical protein WAO83_12915 [Fuerstiella sp.]
MARLVQKNVTTWLTSCLFAAATIVGCGGGETNPPAGTSAVAEPGANSATAPANDASSVSPQQSTANTGNSSDRPHRQNERWTDANGVEYLGEVPLDVFYDQPYMVASDQTPLAGVATNVPAQSPGGMTSGGTMSDGDLQVAADSPAVVPPADADNAAVGWTEIMPMSVLTTEVNSIRNFLNESLQSVGSYNRSMLMIAPKAASLAVLSGIVMEHPETLNWKDDAIYVRDLAKKMNLETLQPGKKDQDRLLRLFENVASILDRSKPAGLEEPEASDSYADVAEMRLVMMRMEASQKKLKTEAGSESSFTSQKEMVQHEAAILGAMTHVVTLPGYGYEDDPEFVGYAKKIVEAAREIRNASDASDFATYELALTKVSTACQECHSQYKNN